ncbi:MAG: energy transducer TonB [Bacteroidales bacterium]|nr:energy transducer TonB [Bacteroidales bacterium]
MKKHHLLLVLILIIMNSVNAQQDTSFVKASFEGNIDEYFARKLTYPRALIEQNIKGRTILSLEIGKQGEIESIVVDEFPHIDLAKEPLAILKTTEGKWSPTLINNEPSTFVYKVIVNYDIQKGQSVSTVRSDIKQARPSPPAVSKEVSLMFKEKALRKLKKEQNDKALILINKAIQSNPYYAEYYKIRSEIQQKLNNLSEAANDAKLAVKYEREILLNINIVSYAITRKVVPGKTTAIRRM